MQRDHPRTHLSGRAVGESEATNTARRNTLGDQPGDTVRDHACLAGTRPGEHEARPPRVCHSLKLLRVQVSFERLRVHRTILRGAEQCGWRVLLLLLDRN
mgnify:FL=1